MQTKLRKTRRWIRHLPVLLALILVVTGCGERRSLPASSSAADTVSDAEELPPVLTQVTAAETIQELMPDLQVVQITGDQGFAEMLKQGGADSDQKVIEFLSRRLSAHDLTSRFPDTGFGCSTLLARAQNGWLFGRNFDWQACRALVLIAAGQTGYASISTVNLDFITAQTGASPLPDAAVAAAAYFAPLDGMNEKGLAISVNMIQDPAVIEQDNGHLNLTTTTAIRYLLNEAADVKEALSLLEEIDLHSSMGVMIHYAMADAQGRSVAVEYVDNQMIVTETPVVTNFYFAEGPKKNIGTAQSHRRYDILTERLTEFEFMNEEDVRDALDRVSKHHFNEFESTEWSLIYNLQTLQTTLYHREDYTRGFQFQLPEESEE